MKGVILAGGTGSRLYPLTQVTNKHLLPVYNKPMIYYPIERMAESGIKDILLVCGGNAAGEFLRILGNGDRFGVRLHYTYQPEAKGISDALGLAEQFVGGSPMCVILGDNLFEKPFTEAVRRFENDPVGAVVFGTKTEHPEHYGVIDEESATGKVRKIVEKPKHFVSNLIATGLYMYDSTVWDFIKQLTPSARGELEITDVNNHYLEKGQLRLERVDGWWADCGENCDGYLDAGIQAREWERSRQSA